jgi:tyrosinase
MSIILRFIMIIDMIALLLSAITLVVGQRTELPDFASSSMTVASSQLDQLGQFALDVTKNVIHHSTGNCTLETLRFRRDWRAFSTLEKKAYLESVLYLQALPARTPSMLAPGARTRYDDFVATHINQTDFIHRSV